MSVGKCINYKMWINRTVRYLCTLCKCINKYARCTRFGFRFLNPVAIFVRVHLIYQIIHYVIKQYDQVFGYCFIRCAIHLVQSKTIKTESIVPFQWLLFSFGWSAIYICILLQASKCLFNIALPSFLVIGF